MRSCEFPPTPNDHCMPTFRLCDPVTYDMAADNTLRSGYVPVEPPGAAPQILPFEAVCVTFLYQSGVNGCAAMASIAGWYGAVSLEVRRVAELQEQPVGQRGRDLDLADVVERVHRVADVGGGDRVVAGEELRILVFQIRSRYELTFVFELA